MYCLLSAWQTSPKDLLNGQIKESLSTFLQFYFLGNEIGMSLGALKDIIQLGISGGALVTAFVVGYLIQDINEAKERGKLEFLIMENKS